MLNLTSFIRFHARRTPEALAVIYGETRLDYATVLARIEKTAGLLDARGIGAGDIVAVVMKNSAAFIELAFAASHIGAVFLPINYRLAAEEVSYITHHAGAKLIFADTELSALVDGVENLVLVDTAAQSDSTRLAGDAAPAPMHVVGPEQLFRLMYTSGTTDRPKGVMHTYGNFYWKNADHAVALGLTSEDRLLVTGPLYHVGAFDLPGMAVLWVGGAICIHRDFDPVAAIRSIQEEQLTGAWFAPVMLGAILAHPERAHYVVSSIKWVVGGGERTPEPRIRAFADCFTKARYIDAYGLTESCSGDTMMEAGREIEKIGSVGRALAHVEVEIRDEIGNVVPPSESGEICLRGPKITRGYWKDPEKTRASFFGDWFRTGDIGHVDAQGFLYLTDRKKDMIISGGENIASSEVERVIYKLAAVREVAVIGLPDEHWGERPVAIVVLNEGAALDLAALTAHCRANLAGFKVPKEMIIRDQLPRNPSGKILKRVLRAEFAG